MRRDHILSLRGKYKGYLSSVDEFILNKDREDDL
jgi:hypothetical protein